MIHFLERERRMGARGKGESGVGGGTETQTETEGDKVGGWDYPDHTWDVLFPINGTLGFSGPRWR